MDINIYFHICLDIEKKSIENSTKQKNKTQPIIVPLSFGRKTIMYVCKDRKNKSNLFLKWNGVLNGHNYILQMKWSPKWT